MMSDNMYILRVRLSWAKGVWREIAMLGNHTLDELHHAILDAFEWTNDDTYCFNLGNDITDSRKLYTPDNDIGSRDSKIICLADLNLKEEQTFWYIFADGDRNQFPIKVMIIDDPDKRLTYPDVVDENGESPDQELAYH
jgi:hypothetical protein